MSSKEVLIELQTQLEELRNNLSELSLEKKKSKQLKTSLGISKSLIESLLENIVTSDKNWYNRFTNYLDPVLILNNKMQVIFQNIPFKNGVLLNSGETFFNWLGKKETQRVIVELDNIISRGVTDGSMIVELPSSDKHIVRIHVIKQKQQSYYLLQFFDFNLRLNGYTSATNDASLESLRVVSENLDDVLFMLDEGLRFVYCSPAIERVLKYQAKEIVGQTFEILIPEWSKNRIEFSKGNLDNARSSLTNKTEMQLVDKFGKLSWYEVFLTYVSHPDDRFCGYNGILRDSSDRVKYENALKEAKRKAEESDLLKSAFLANMSHEIRTPLNGIVGFTAMLNNDNLTKEKKETYINYILSGSKQLLTLVNDIIDISKIEAGQLDIKYIETDIHEIFNELEDNFRNELIRLDKSHIKIVTQKAKKQKKFFITTDEVRLKQVLINLIGNAVKFTSEGEIKFGYHLPNEFRINFFVEDTGIGIPPDKHKLVFDRFRKGEDDSMSGTGLGLAISKGIVELLGGSISFKSEVELGTRFEFSIPVKPLGKK